MSEYLPSGETTNSGRTFLFAAIVCAVFGWYSSYLFYLQLVRGGEYKVKAVSISRQVAVLPSQRGEIYDRNQTVPLVLNVDSFALSVIPAELPAEMRDTVFLKLAELLDEPVDSLRRKVPPSYYGLYQPIEIMRSVRNDIVVTIAERIDEFPGVTWYSKPKRNYLETGSFAHLIGFVGDITREELKVLYNRGYQAGDIVGKAGVEFQYDAELRGKDGREFSVVDVRGRNISEETKEAVPPVMGKNLVLTIDRNAQIAAEKALGRRNGSIVVLKPATGEVLALVSYPAYDANALVERNGNNEYARLLGDATTPLINRAIQSSYPPASTFKSVLTAAAVEEHAIPLDKKILCEGDLSYGERVFHCWKKRPGHGYLDLLGGLSESCDIYFWTLARDYLGVERIVTYAKEFGFGKATGIDLPGEVEGFVPTPQWKERKFHEKWLGGDTLNIAIGQGDTLATPLQVADMMAMIVNEGTIFKPHILKEIREPGTNAIISTSNPELLYKTNLISKESFRKVQEGLRMVCTVGTARYAISTKTVQVAGKTGTAEIGLDDRWHAWFAAYGPYDAKDPEDVIVVVTMVEASNPWEWWAPHAANIVFQSWFGNQTFEEAVATLGIRTTNLVPTARIE